MIGSKEKIKIWLNVQNDELFEIKPYKEKRSLSQNAYAWKLITEIGNKISKSKEEIYMEMLKSYGQSEIISILSNINPEGYFKYYEEIGRGFVNNKEFKHLKVYKGSSEFDSKEMSIFIDGIIQECEQLDIQTKSKEEIERMNLI